jgi:methyltransferase-like protein/protein-L-isoaspartate O-methyltransferase
MHPVPATSYDALPYPNHAFAATHPDRLAALALLFGLAPAPPQRCRVLELGCAGGGNLIPMAEALPDSQFVGIDLSERQIAAGRETVRALGLKNITLDQLDLRDLPRDAGPFDYVIAHGLYSWVPADVQERLLEICGRNLAPNGVAYVSHSVLPGAHSRLMLREMMCYHARHAATPPERAARARELLALLAGAAPPERAYHAVLAQEQERLHDKGDAHLLHDDLADVNAPLYFHEFMGRAGRHGLQFLAEAEGIRSTPERLGPEAVAALRRLAGDLLAREQYMDFLFNRAFRRTLLCRADQPLRPEPRPADVAALHLASRARPVSPSPEWHSTKVEGFQVPGGATGGSDHPLTKVAFLQLAEAWPEALSFADLEARARARLAPRAVVVQDGAAHARDSALLAENLRDGILGGLVEPHAGPVRLRTEPGERPRAPGYARLQAGQGTSVTNLRHEMVSLDQATCQLLGELDGTRDRAALLDGVLRRVAEQKMVVQRHGRPVTDPGALWRVLAESVETTLRWLGRAALLVE